MFVIHADEFGDLMDMGHRAMQAEENDTARRYFMCAARVASEGNQLSSAGQMEGVALRKLGMFNRADEALTSALQDADSDTQKAKVLRDLGMLYLDLAEAPTGTLSRYHFYTKAEDALQESYELFCGALKNDEMFATLGFQGRVAYLRGDIEEGRNMMRVASFGLRGHPVYQLNNHVWLMLASPWRRWYLLPVGIWLVLSNKSNRTLGAFARVFVAAGGQNLYDDVQRRRRSKNQ